MTMEIYWTFLEYEDWTIYLAATEQGLNYVGISMDELNAGSAKRFKEYSLVEDDGKLAAYKEELLAYLKGERKEFMMRLDAGGTKFQQSVWQALKEIPYGETTTYSAIANQINNPKAVRAVGTAIGANPILIIVPCHRVIGKDGQLTGFRSGIPMKKALLALER
ncbi:methylated-DNA--[protein]-cysteine S-methyltransferase [Viridibacillus sp. YIM B01967]|uniref:Methylated-DNA--protein-cysteine methyltransferase n=1 Tax=Viridibacillus soli TaxID=2798301 RepID=A0ABS1HAC6_9BACL|nr:methylated-DNA--[protein]-cysteine S-methyltransferase [Viridibacillus soli]MBK3496229.1 methylated-DNA--[protein]-cysteine S-methyltransferase [Viridibacillus soli]